MKNWKKAVVETFSLSRVTFHSPIQIDEVLDLERWIGGSLPAELRDIYDQFNGFNCNSSGYDWEPLKPASRVPGFTLSQRASFGAHPELAERLLFVFDWPNGDATGYLWDAEGFLMEGLWTFDHEAYEADASQQPEEFLFNDFENFDELFRKD
jgi:hypothetical protein